MERLRDRATSRTANSTDCREVQAVAPPGAMYAFFRVEGLRDSLALCKRLVADHGLGLARASPSAEGEGCVRWCFASESARLAEVRRLEAGLATRTE